MYALVKLHVFHFILIVCLSLTFSSPLLPPPEPLFFNYFNTTMTNLVILRVSQFVKLQSVDLLETELNWFSKLGTSAFCKYMLEISVRA